LVLYQLFLIDSNVTNRNLEGKFQRYDHMVHHPFVAQ
jgi:hypothetical protein